MEKSKYVFKDEELYRKFVDCEIFKDFIKQLKNSEYFNYWFFRKDLNPANYKYLFSEIIKFLNDMKFHIKTYDKLSYEVFISSSSMIKICDLDKKEE